MDGGGRATHDCTEAGGRATQDAKAEDAKAEDAKAEDAKAERGRGEGCFFLGFFHANQKPQWTPGASCSLRLPALLMARNS